MTVNWTDADRRAVDTLRVLAADAVEKVGNGHPGTAISLAPAAYLLYQNVMRHNPADSHWLGRDRFVLSAGHSSLTQYLQLFASGYKVSLDDIKALRTWGSVTPGHPEVHHTDGVETTTGPLGQGVATAVGMAMAARRERGLLDPHAPEGESPFDHHIYVIASDGDLQEGVSAEASSLAGTQELGNLTVIWDDNNISIEDDTDVAFTEDVIARYKAYGWDTHHVAWKKDGQEYVEDIDALADALAKAKAETSKPSFIALSTIIGWPSPTKQDTGAIHGSKLGTDEVRALKELLGFDPDKSFVVEPEIAEHMLKVRERGQAAQSEWNADLARWEAENPERAELLARFNAKKLPEGWTDSLPEFEAGKDVATRAASGEVLTALAPVLPELWGGSADLAGSNNTTMKGEPSFIPEHRSTEMFKGHPYGRTLHFGIREHAMGAILNGIALHGPTRAYGGTFLTFSDYMRPAVRLGALMKAPSIFVWTHDSIGLGEDGPTHQPIEHLASLRAIPGLAVVRPADANETSYAWRGILERDNGPAGIILTRQGVPTFDRTDLGAAEGVLKGAYVLADTDGTPDVILIGTGSEVQHALGARDILASEGIKARVVSMPCREWFDEQSDEYRESVIPAGVKARVIVEAGIAQPWYDIAGDAGRIVSIEDYGASADANLLFEKFGFTADNVAAHARESLAAAK